ncbi:lysophospholipid acyltransferase family protein [Thermincola potens]|uniref:1-acyl-sn-glycerol-3-phosphate acyltransferase n=1 Tax=Thermincola potens (strain JR) TaxID=635013 RepID=D5XFM2_THEPJ|nr:lysophospholipid acyltransferase family protein [Thermincola potens]ADG82443.1 1-acyl-sn-glycerol-3-phosphate acyltransferase [Thermincola potens JR]
MIYRVAWVLVLAFLKIAAGFKIIGRENQVPSGPVIVVSNHVSNWDPLALGTALTRQVHFMAKDELFRNFLLAWLLRKLGVIPVKRGRTAKSAIVESLKVLKKGEVLGIFPEGTRNLTGEILKPNAGAVMLALRARAPILPVALSGTREFRKMKAIIGKPIYLDQYYDEKLDKKQIDKISEDIMNNIRQLLKTA